jgi:hypothetical protein
VPERVTLAMPTHHVSAETIKQYYRVDRREIAFLRFIFEAYDGLAVLETLDPEAGLIVFHIAPGCERDIETILQDLQKDIMMEPAPDPDKPELTIDNIQSHQVIGIK